MRWPWQRHDRDLFQIGSIVPASTYAAVPVNPTTAMQHSAVWACTDLIASAISTLPLYAYRKGELEPLPDVPPILRQPSATMDLVDFLYAALRALLVQGNCYGLIVDRAGAGLLPSQVELLANERVQVEANSRIIWRVDGNEIDPSSLWHVKAFTVPGQVLGLSPIAHAARPSAWASALRSTPRSSSASPPSPPGSSPPITTSSRSRPTSLRPAGGNGTRATATSPSSAPAPASRPSPSRPRKPSSWRRPRRTSGPSAATTGCNPR
jgi:hypothetical protein